MNSNLLAKIGHFIRRYPFGATCIGLALLLAGANVWLRLNLESLTNRQHDAAVEGDRMLTMIARGPQLRNELTMVRTATQRITENLIVQKNIPENYGYFFGVEQDAHAKLTELQQGPAIVPESGAPTTYKRVPFSLRFNGPFPSIIAALERLEYGPRLGRIDGFQMQRTGANAGDLTIQVDFELLGFP